MACRARIACSVRTRYRAAIYAECLPPYKEAERDSAGRAEAMLAAGVIGNEATWNITRVRMLKCGNCLLHGEPVVV